MLSTGELNLLNFSIDSFALFLLFTFFICGFVYWHETQRDGFDTEKSIDLLLLSLLSSYLMSRLFFSIINNYDVVTTSRLIITPDLTSHNIFGLALGAFLPLAIFTRTWRWSIYRMLDIFSLIFCISTALLFLGLQLFKVSSFNLFLVIGVVFYFVSFLIIVNYRLILRSGYSFSLFLIFNILFGAMFFRKASDLIFYMILLTMSLVNFIYRFRIMPTIPTLPKDFINKIKSRLVKEDADLGKLEKKLVTEDPYLSPERDSDNEYLTDVVEDVQKETHDLRLKSVRDFRVRVKKALALLRIGRYGICEVCGTAIEEERLEAYPEATKCIKHAS